MVKRSLEGYFPHSRPVTKKDGPGHKAVKGGRKELSVLFTGRPSSGHLKRTSTDSKRGRKATKRWLPWSRNVMNLGTLTLRDQEGLETRQSSRHSPSHVLVVSESFACSTSLVSVFVQPDQTQFPLPERAHGGGPWHSDDGAPSALPSQRPHAA